MKQGVFGTLFLSLLLITFSLDCYADITGPYKPPTQQVPMAYLSLIGSGNTKPASIDMAKGWSVGAEPYKGSGGRNIARDLKAEDKLELSLYKKKSYGALGLNNGLYSDFSREDLDIDSSLLSAIARSEITYKWFRYRAGVKNIFDTKDIRRNKKDKEVFSELRLSLSKSINNKLKITFLGKAYGDELLIKDRKESGSIELHWEPINWLSFDHRSGIKGNYKSWYKYGLNAKIISLDKVASRVSIYQDNNDKKEIGLIFKYIF